ncbi:MAG: hypothetical protein K8T90_12625 [Planctomycetes bacterium]|nr:hypothetical protein [Planctomycetota bacterium]
MTVRRIRTRAAAAIVGAIVLPLFASLLASCRHDVEPPPPPAPAILVPPLHDAVAGEELRLRRGNEDWIWRIASVSDTELEVEFRRMQGGAPLGQTDILRWPRNQFGIKDDYVVHECRRDRIEAAGRTWDCWLVRAGSKTEAIWYWVTDELPVHGVIRMAKDERGKPLMGSAATVVPDACSKPQ